MWLLGQHKRIHLEKEPAQNYLCEQLLSRKDLSNWPVEVPNGLGSLLLGHQWCQGSWDTSSRLCRGSTVISTHTEHKHLPLSVWLLPQAPPRREANL